MCWPLTLLVLRETGKKQQWFIATVGPSLIDCKAQTCTPLNIVSLIYRHTPEAKSRETWLNLNKSKDLVRQNHALKLQSKLPQLILFSNIFLPYSLSCSSGTGYSHICLLLSGTLHHGFIVSQHTRQHLPSLSHSNTKRWEQMSKLRNLLGWAEFLWEPV